MWKSYQQIVSKYTKITLFEERLLITKAQKGSKKSTEEIVMRHIGFVIFRIHKKVFPEYLKRFGEDLLSDSIPILYQKIQTYDLDYRDRCGHTKPAKFVSYIWKRIDGFIIDSLKKEFRESNGRFINKSEYSKKL